MAQISLQICAVQTKSIYMYTVIRPFKQCKVDQSVEAILYQSDNAGVHVKTEHLLFEYADKFQMGQPKWHIRRGLPTLSVTKETSWLVRIPSEACTLAFKVVKCCESSYLQ